MTVPARTPAAQLRFSIAILALAALWLAMLVLGAGALDRTIYEALYAGHRPVLVTIARGFTFLGEPTVLLAAGSPARCGCGGRRGTGLRSSWC